MYKRNQLWTLLLGSYFPLPNHLFRSVINTLHGSLFTKVRNKKHAFRGKESITKW